MQSDGLVALGTHFTLRSPCHPSTGRKLSLPRETRDPERASAAGTRVCVLGPLPPAASSLTKPQSLVPAGRGDARPR